MSQRESRETLNDLEARHDPWPAPLPLVPAFDPALYPTDALPEVIRAAVQEVQSFTQCPISMVASSALSVLSVGAQHMADVKRAEGLTGPSSLFFLTIAESGERKTTCDGFFRDPIQQWQQQQVELRRPALDDYKGRLAVWEAKQDGLRDRVRLHAKKQDSATEAESELAQHEHDRPEAPRVPRVLRVDDTPESLAWSLAHEWPSGGIMSSEAGLVFGSHGMNHESMMRNLALLNTIWDGVPLPIARRTSDSYTVRGARLTVALQIQEPALKAFFERSNGLARGIGFLARFLVAAPISTQGQRPYIEPPAAWPRLSQFQRRLLTLLDEDVPIRSDGTLTPQLLAMTPDAKQTWVTFHDDVEAELRAGGELATVRDVAAKAADNAARLACLFHVLLAGPRGEIGRESVWAAARIVAWHLNEARRFFGNLTESADESNAAKLDSWLVGRCQDRQFAEISAREIQQYGPYAVRCRRALESALDLLEQRGRCRIDHGGTSARIRLNPALLKS